jgi:hypothetical protein
VTPPAADDEEVPVSVRLGAVVPPEDPEDWSRPLTWVAAIGMLAGPLAAVAWILVARPDDASALLPGTLFVAVALVAGAVLTGSTQIGRSWAFAGTLGAGLFGALLTVVAGTVLGGERQAAASPALALSFAAAVGGAAGALGAAIAAFGLGDLLRRERRWAPSAAVGLVVALVVARLLVEQ